MEVTIPTDSLMDSFYAAETVDPKNLAVEAELIYLKFPDYAFMSAVESTRLFRKYYTETYRRYYEKYFSVHESQYKIGVKSADLFKNPTFMINGLWKSRQFADALGVEYEFYINAAFKLLFEDRKYKRLPAANQLYSEHVIHYVEKKWADHLVDPYALYPAAQDPRFQSNLYCNEPAQDQYIKTQLNRIRSSPAELKKRLAGFCFYYRTLNPDIIDSEFKLDRDEVKSLWSGKEFVYREVTNVSEFYRPCFGLLHVKDVLECDTCPNKKACHERRERVSRMMIGKYKTDDPRAEKRRIQARERKRRQREKEKLP